MATVITYLDNRRVHVASHNGLFVCAISEFNRQHNGVWSDNCLSFAPKPSTFDEAMSILADPDNIPICEPAYTDHSGIYYDYCEVCGIHSNGNRYCGPSCEQKNSEA